MSFWGVEVKPGKPFTHVYDRAKGRLRVCQATLGNGSAASASKRVLVQCNIGNRSPVLLCSLWPDKTDSCPVGVEFEELEEVIFSVIGPRSIHLVGYYLSNNSLSCANDDSESYGEDIANTESGESNHCGEEDEYEDSFINDGDPEIIPPSPVSNEFISEDEKPKNGNHRRLRKKYQQIESDNENNFQPQIAVDGVLASEAEDEDKLPISSIYESTTERNKESDGSKRTNETQKSNQNVISSKRNAETPVLDSSPGSSKPKRRKKKHEDGQALEIDHVNHYVIKDDIASQDETKAENLGQDLKHTQEWDSANDKSLELSTTKQVEKRKKKKKNRKEESQKTDGDMDVEVLLSSIEENTGPLGVTAERNANPESPQVRTLSSGLVIEDLELGQADGKVASHGKKVGVHFILRLKEEDDQIVDSNIGKVPFKFRLGREQVIQGLTIGVDGMRVGGKRKLIIPPSLGYGTKGDGDKVPPNSWVIYDIELVKVH